MGPRAETEGDLADGEEEERREGHGPGDERPRRTPLSPPSPPGSEKRPQDAGPGGEGDVPETGDEALTVADRDAGEDVELPPGGEIGEGRQGHHRAGDQGEGRQRPPEEERAQVPESAEDEAENAEEEPVESDGAQQHPEGEGRGRAGEEELAGMAQQPGGEEELAPQEAGEEARAQRFPPAPPGSLDVAHRPSLRRASRAPRFALPRAVDYLGCLY